MKKDKLSKSEYLANTALDLIKNGKSIEEIYRIFPNNTTELKEIFKTLNILRYIKNQNTSSGNISQSDSNKSANQNQMRNKKVFSDIIRIDKKVTKKKKKKTNFLYNNSDNIYQFQHRTPADKIDKCKKNSDSSTYYKKIINNNIYLGLTISIFIFFIINIFSSKDSSIDVENFAQKLENENQNFEKNITEIYQNRDDSEQLINKINHNFPQLSESVPDNLTDEFLSNEKELLYEIDDLDTDIDELYQFDISNNLQNIEKDITNI